MSNTQVTQLREAIAVSGTAKYRITTTCSNKGALQDTNIFLLTIVNTTDPKDDTFNRVIEIADLEAYSIDRPTAIDNGDGLWRSSTATLIYDDIETANAAWKELSSRINLLVETYDSFLLEFATPPSGNIIVYPTIDESGKTALKDDYYAAEAATATAQAALDAHTCSLIETNIDTTEERLTEANSDLSLYVGIQASATASLAAYGAIYGVLTVNNGSLHTLNATSSSTDAEKDQISAPLNINDSYLTQFSAQNTAFNTLTSGSIATATSTLQIRVRTLTQEKNTLFTDLNKCRTEEAKLQAALTTALSTQQAALAAVVAVCPDFVP